MESYLYLIAGWVIYFFIHSFLAADSVKLFFREQLGKYFSVYRFVYVIISIVGLYFLVRINVSIESEFIIEFFLTTYLGIFLASLGVLVIALSFRSYSLAGFLGLRNEKNDFRGDGILRYTRHPIYLGTILIVVGYWLICPDFPTLASAVVIMIYLAIGIRLEEQKLVKTFGETYLKYKQEVPMIFPRIKH